MTAWLRLCGYQRNPETYRPSLFFVEGPERRLTSEGYRGSVWLVDWRVFVSADHPHNLEC